MLIESLFGKNILFTVSPLRIRKCYKSFQVERYSDILAEIKLTVECNCEKKMLSFFTRRIYPCHMRYVHVRVRSDERYLLRVKMYPFRVEVIKGDPFKFFYNISQEIAEDVKYGKEN